ncbi:MAG: 50S ribosomal protein L10 [Alphaproteobacteria bacterium]|nr:50S ribosomal protein L10 [Alphaproteobacteria bacterium]
MNRSEKENLVSLLREDLQKSNLVVVTRQVGLTVGEVSDLRQKMRDSGATYKVVKNTLARLIVADTPYATLTEFLNGPTALAFSQDPVAAAKIAVNFSETNEKLEVVGGSLGSQVLNKQAVQALAKLPSLDELRGKLIGVISAPASKIASVIQAPAAQLARVCSAYGSK